MQAEPLREGRPRHLADVETDRRLADALGGQENLRHHPSAADPMAEALAGYGAWCVPWSALIALRFAQVRRSLVFAAELAPADDVEALRRVVAFMARRIDASDREEP